MDSTGRRATHSLDCMNNNLLRALRPDDFRLLEPLLTEWHGERGQILHEPGETVRHVHFPCGPSLISYLVVLEDGRAIETALIGREGAAGGIVSQGRLPAYGRAEVQFPGEFLRIGSAELEAAKLRSLTLRHLFARYADCLMAHIFQSVACNAAHSIEQRTAKWLIAAMERTGDRRIPLTQEQLSAMMGVGRSYISRILQSLKASGMIATRRGGLVVNDVDGLHRLACGCNEATRRHFDDVLQGVYPSDEETNMMNGAPRG
ncbi:MAG: Crp/Fnr family transcriptional regulator [Allosphingosinicella sp.]|uniref:Crp/Fnr family transcriptional regulator n=1 Tax=Allosphingosinicella sp. TaxID=2823234 RepID=UPI00392083D1